MYKSKSAGKVLNNIKNVCFSFICREKWQAFFLQSIVNSPNQLQICKIIPVQLPICYETHIPKITATWQKKIKWYFYLYRPENNIWSFSCHFALLSGCFYSWRTNNSREESGILVEDHCMFSKPKWNTATRNIWCLWKRHKRCDSWLDCFCFIYETTWVRECYPGDAWKT